MTIQNKAFARYQQIWPWVVVFAVLIFVGIVRVRLANMPLERDEGEYAYAGQLILQGIPPYELAYNMKLPGTYYAYAMGMAVFGQDAVGIRLTLLVANALTIVFVFLLARKLFGTSAGLISCASYGVMSLSTLVQGLLAHANHFVVLFAVPATLLLLKAREDRELRLWFFSGLLYGLAFVMKQQGIFFCAFGVLFVVWNGIVERTIFSAAFVKKFLLFSGGSILPFAFVCLSCVIAGDFPRFIFWTFVYARWYATDIPFSVGYPFLRQHLQDTFPVSIGFYLITAAGLILLWRDVHFRSRIIFTIMFWLFSCLAMAVGFYFRGHYFILLLPAFAILTGAGITGLQKILSGKRAVLMKALPVILYLFLFGWAVTYQFPTFFKLLPDDVCLTLYPQNPFLEARVAGKFIAEHASPKARIAVFGSEPEIYFYSRRHSATGYIYTYALMEPQPAADLMQQEMSSEIETNRPDYMVIVRNNFSWLPDAESHMGIFDWLTHYLQKNFREIAVVGVNSRGKVILVGKNGLNDLPSFIEPPLEIYQRTAATNLSQSIRLKHFSKKL